MKVTEATTYRLMNTNLNQITTTLQDLRNQGATGLKLNDPSDDPSSIRPVLTTRTQIRHTERYLETMGVTLDKMQSTDGHLEHVENILQRAKEIAINAVNGAMSDADLDVLADEIDNLTSELLDASNAMVDGKYVFSGYSENTIPFVENAFYDPNLWSADNPNTWKYLYQGDPNPTELEITPGELLESTLTGNDLFQGISNATMTSGVATQPPLTGIQQGNGMSFPVAAGDTITINAAGPPAINVTITAADLNTATDNYAQQSAGLIDGSTNSVTTGLSATVEPSSSSVSGVFTPTTGVADFFSVNGEVLASGPTPSGALFDQKINNYITTTSNANPTRAGGSVAVGNAWFTDSNGNIISITGSAAAGDLQFIANNGANLMVSETVANPAEGFTTASYAGASETTYGTVTVGTNTPDNVTLGGAALANVGLTPANLDGANAYPPDSKRLDVFSTLVRLEEALRASNNDDPNGPGGGIQANIDNLELAADQNRRLRSQLGNRANRVDTAMLHQEDVKVDLNQILSRYQDADAIETFNEIIKQETAFQAALNVTARISKVSILDYF